MEESVLNFHENNVLPSKNRLQFC